MDYKHSFDILTEYTDDLKNMVTAIGKSKKIPSIDLDLLLDKTRDFYEMLLMLKKYSSSPFSEITAEPETVKKEPITETKTPDAEKIAGIQPNIEPEKKPEPTKPETIHRVSEKQTEEKKTVSDRFKKQTTSLHDNIVQSQQHSDLSTKLQSKPISNITGAIGLNEKFAFIHHLFRGDTDKYDETMQVLNNASDFNVAYNYLIENFDWDMDNELVQKILELIRRKLIKSKNE